VMVASRADDAPKVGLGVRLTTLCYPRDLRRSGYEAWGVAMDGSGDVSSSTRGTDERRRQASR
jgi:hypothetical protein